MSNDLISRSEVVKIIEEEIEKKLSYEVHDAQIDIMFKVKELPVAYNVDKVVERLEKAKYEDDLYPCNLAVEIEEAKSIVKSGGIEWNR